MTTSGTYNFNPALSRLVIAAYSRIGLRRTQLVVEHMSDAAFEANLLLCQWSNLQPNLWLSELKSETLVAGVDTYTLDPEIVAIQVAYISTSVGGQPVDRPLGPMSTVEYFSMPNKTIQGYPTAFWFDRQVTPSIKVWPVPDDTQTYTLKIRCVRQVQDATMPAGMNVEIPYRFNTAFVDGLADRLGAVYPEQAKAALGPTFADILDRRASKSWEIAASQDQEQGVEMYITPSFGGYYR